MISTSNCRNKPSSFTSVQDNDVMIEILIRLPLKSLLKFKCVCKWWCRLISDPVFLSNYSHRNPNLYVSGFYLQKLLFLQMYSELQFITFDGENDAAPKPSLSFIEDEGGVFIRHSCNGLLLCSSFRCLEADRIYYVCKPTTKQYHRLPKFRCKNVFGTSVLCDPSKLTQYRIIFVCDSELSVSHRQIKMYHSDDGLWRESGNPFFASDDILFNRGVFWNGALHWVGRGELALSFDVEQECLHEMPMPPVKEGWAERRLGYFGESGDHLYLIEIYGPLTAGFDVMEMKRDYSGWFVKYHVNINAVAANYPIMIRQNVQEMHHFVFSLMHVIHRHLGEKEESILVLHIPGKFISYNLIDETFMDLGNVSHCLTNRDVGLGLEYSWEGLYPYVNTLSYL